MRIFKISPLISFKSNNILLTNEPVSDADSSRVILHGGGGDSFNRHSDAINIVRMKQLDIKNFRLVDSSSVRGQCLNQKPKYVFDELRESGIETIIDFRTEGSPESKYARKCEASGLEYFNFKIKESMPIFNSMGSSGQSFEEFRTSREVFVKDLDKFFKLMERGRVYMACLLGLHRTDLAVSLNYLLNPKEPQTPPSLSHIFYKNEENLTNKRIGAVKNLVKNLTAEHKEFLDIPKELGSIFSERIAKLRMMNLVKV